MKKSFAISQFLYVTMPNLPMELQSFAVTRCADGSARLELATGVNETIFDQHVAFADSLDRIVEALSNKECETVFSVAVRAYEYIPEISLPARLIQSLSRINSSIDVDVINMVDGTTKGDGGN